MDWTDCVTSREYIKHGLVASSGFYIGTVGFLLIWSIFSSGNLGTYVSNIIESFQINIHFYFHPVAQSSTMYTSLCRVASHNQRFHRSTFIPQISANISLSSPLPVYSLPSPILYERLHRYFPSSPCSITILKNISRYAGFDDAGFETCH